MEYSKKSFSGCLFNPIVEGKMLTEYPKLCEIILPEWSNSAELNSLLRYMVMMYDPKSPLVFGERDLNYRKSVAANLCGITDQELLDNIFSFQHLFLVDLVVRFLVRFVKSKEFTAIVVVESCFWESTKKLLEPITGKNSKEELEAVQKKSAIKDEMDKDIARLEKYYAAFYGDDPLLQLKAKERASPEALAKLKK